MEGNIVKKINTLCIAALVAYAYVFITACAGPTAVNHKTWTENGGQVTLGMTPPEVRKALGPPTKIEGADAVGQALFKGGVYDNMYGDTLTWYYGDFKTDDHVLIVEFKQGMVQRITTYDQPAQ